jgi:hypothetical protein
MQGLSSDIQKGLDVIIEGLNYELEVELIEPDKIKASMESKLESFRIAKELLLKWYNSPNKPSQAKFEIYVGRIIHSGQASLKTLSEALGAPIDYEALDTSKHKSAMQAKLVILKSINEMESSIAELTIQLETGTINLKESEFKRGYAEKFAYQEFYPEENYYKDYYDEDNDVLNIDPHGTKGEIFVLDGLKVQIPEVPKNKKDILYWDKKKDDQYWRREPLPQGCTPDNAEPFASYILGEFKRRREGVWFYNNGEPTWLSPRHWFQLQWARMMDDGIYPSYRDAQRKLFYHKEACYIDAMCMGQIFLKSRQTGYTYGMMSDSINMVTSRKNITTGLTSMTDDDARKAFGKMVYTFQELPFFFQPIVKGRADSPNQLLFAKPSDASKESKKKKELTTDGYVNSSTDFQATKVKAYDGQHMKLYIGDESAKWDRADYIEHLNTLLPTTFRGGRVVGKVFLGSTMGKLDSGGESFKVLYLNSRVTDRQESGYTSTKLYSYFMPAHTNYEFCIDKFGKCWEITPPKGTRNIFGDLIKKGSIQSIKELYEDAKQQGEVALNAAYRAFPMTENHAMRDEAESCVFNLGKLTDQDDYNDGVAEYKRYVRGNFEWENDVRFSKVIFYPDERGRFKVAWMPSDIDGTLKLRNNVTENRGYFFPLNDFGCIGVDCYGSYTKGKNKQSRGAAHLYFRGNGTGAPQHKFIFEYLDKPATQDVFNEDILKAAWFYGMPILAENNRRDFVRYTYLNKCRGFNMNRVDKSINELSGDDLVLGGQPMTGQDILTSHENAIRTFIQRRVGVANDVESIKFRTEGEMGDMPFEETIRDWMKFDPSNRTAFDATISSGLAIMGTEKEKYIPQRKKTEPKKYVPLFKKYKNNGDIGSIIKK